jgi:hypothetical protein
MERLNRVDTEILLDTVKYRMVPLNLDTVKYRMVRLNRVDTEILLLGAGDLVGSQVQGPCRRILAVDLSAAMVYGRRVEGTAKIGGRMTAGFLVAAGSTEGFGEERESLGRDTY